MDTKPINPLAKHFRSPAIFLKLPSKGLYWKDGSIEMPQNGELPIYPMTAQDEILLKTPDALMNGQGVVDVIQSCCPSIKNAWDCPSIDVDALLIAIRIASYGNDMEFTSKCPHCNEEHNYSLPLGSILESVHLPDYSTPVISQSLAIKLTPQKYFSVNKTNQINFEEERILQTLVAEDVSDELRKMQFEEHLKKLVELNLQVVTDSTESITTPDGLTVRDKEQIHEFYSNTDNRVLKQVQAKLKEISEQASLKPQTVQCSACSQTFEIPIVFDYANFFV